ncbi:MAG: hypothetical protein IJB86_05605 [Clostridia bacterium]|nr:hypothetical protein [Clostridia bacterium]
MKIKRLSMSQILANDKLVFVISVVLAISLWAVVAVRYSEQQVSVISDIPISIEGSEISEKLALQMFGKTDYTVSVRVSGKRYKVSSSELTKEDFIATASTAMVSGAGKYSLPVSVRLANPDPEIEIGESSLSTVDVYFDYVQSETFPIEVSIPEGTKVVADGFVEGDPLMSISTVTISGAQTEIEKIDRVIAKVNIDTPLTSTEVFKTLILPINKNQGAVRSSYISYDGGVSEVSVTIPVLKATKMRPAVKFKNTPSIFLERPIVYGCTPNDEILVAVAPERLESSAELAIGTIDFASIGLGINSFKFEKKNINEVKVLDDIESINVSFTIGDAYNEKTLTVGSSNITVNGIPDGVAVDVQDDISLNIKVIGLEEELVNVTPENIKGTVDVTGIQEGTGTVDAVITFTVENTTGCWVYGEYKIKVSA